MPTVCCDLGHLPACLQQLVTSCITIWTRNHVQPSSACAFAAVSRQGPYCAGSNYYVRILSTLNRELLKPSASIALHRHSNALVDILPPEADSSISLLTQSERPDVSYTVRL